MNDFGTISEVGQVCSLTLCSLLTRVWAVTDYLKTHGSLPEMILDPIRSLTVHCSLECKWQPTIPKHVTHH